MNGVFEVLSVVMVMVVVVEWSLHGVLLPTYLRYVCMPSWLDGWFLWKKQGSRLGRIVVFLYGVGLDWRRGDMSGKVRGSGNG